MTWYGSDEEAHQILNEAVDAGVAWLDENYPGWETQLDLGTLELTSYCTCVLGQLEGNYWNALIKHLIPADELIQAPSYGAITRDELLTDSKFTGSLKLFVLRERNGDDDDFADAHGFNLPDMFYGGDSSVWWGYLQDRWVYVTKKRLDEGVAP